MAIKYTPRPSPFHTAVNNKWVDARGESERLAELRIKRDLELSKTDWTQVSDAPLSQSKKNEFAAWRKALRDLPNDYPITADAEKEFIVLISNKPTM